MTGAPRQLLKRSEVQEILSMGRHKVDRLRRAGRLQGRRIDGAWYFTARSVRALAEGEGDIVTVAIEPSSL